MEIKISKTTFAEAEAVAALLNEYEVDEATATADVASFVKTLNDPRFVD